MLREVLFFSVREAEHGFSKLIGLVVALAAPVNPAGHLAFLGKFHILHGVFQEFFHTSPVYDIADVLFGFDRGHVQILIQVIVGVLNDLTDASKYDMLQNQQPGFFRFPRHIRSDCHLCRQHDDTV